METPSFAVAFLGGLLLFFSPCIAPVIPAYLSAISGVRWGSLRRERDSRECSSELIEQWRAS